MLIVFARAPVMGRAKTRLIPALGPEGAAELYRCFLLDTIETLRDLDADVAIAAAEGEDVELLAAASPHTELTVQRGANLGERLANALRAALTRGYSGAVVIGSDSPDLSAHLITRAIELIASHDLVLGPCADGGYYLIGVGAHSDVPLSDLLRDIEWSGTTVLADTLDRAKQLGLKVVLLDPWHDVDTPADLQLLRDRLMGKALAGEPIICRRTWEWLGIGLHEAQSQLHTTVIIPALNEEQSIGIVLDAIPAELAADVVVVDNGSTDRTAEIARAHGAKVVYEPERGYGAACLAGIAAIQDAEVVAFLDADFSDDPVKLRELVAPILAGNADLVIGSRMLGKRERGALPLHSLFGNWLAGAILTHLYGQRTTDLGPFRAIRFATLQQLQMQDRGFGWTMEMQAKVARLRARVVEIPVPYRKRIGRSKITGSLIASVQAGAIILHTAFKLLRWRAR